MHEGHRQRLIAKLNTADGLYEHELLEVLLFNACPRKNVNAAAHSLIKAFGSISGVLGSSVEELTAVEGVGGNMAEYLVCLGKCLKKRNGCNSFAVVHSTAEFKDFISVRYKTAEKDGLGLYYLDKDGRIRRICDFEGIDGGRAEVSLRQLLNLIAVYKPYGIFAAYYRAQGGSEPTAEDDNAVGRIAESCALCGVRFYDYCIVGHSGGIYSYFVTDRLTAATNKGAGYGRL